MRSFTITISETKGNFSLFKKSNVVGLTKTMEIDAETPEEANKIAQERFNESFQKLITKNHTP